MFMFYYHQYIIPKFAKQHKNGVMHYTQYCIMFITIDFCRDNCVVAL